VSFGQITHADRVGWQRMATAELGSILDTHRELPVIAWTVGAAGAALTGRLAGPAPAEQVRASFEAWRTALLLGETRETPSGQGTAFLRAVTSRNRVTVSLTATLLDQDGGSRDRRP
jgi:hypothetical protein